jgi:aspartate/methionine/tyrosine aminotransferase
MPSTYYEELQAAFQGRRDTVMDMLDRAGFKVFRPQGSYFVLADWRDVAPFHIQDDVQFARWLTTEIGVACIPPSAFYRNSDKHLARHLARFAVCKRDDTLQAAADRLRKLAH